ncbi:STAS/SEC14 domain-containing protein [Psychromonas sp. MB-3u-54]|uniref:STAS/SEC14 domain-containing protein n=1 Tax=Psychromonas sp. MB-3u-54 TaxID=2058319 RepID=UPI000C31BFC7|nr:STAS/SEC14 domain-containing protein [Psychromonas sp. MB-3u-54]PKH03137.1 STAS/SEC14 domain-containing protein [Psychromonas sp. MB-3u-54]
MIRKLPESEGATIGINVSGKIDLEQENQWFEVFNKLIEEHEQINILVVLDGKINFGLDVAYQDLKWIFKHFKNINKLAIVSESKKLAWLVAADSPFGKLVGVSEKHFELSRLQDAWRWVKE